MVEAYRRFWSAENAKKCRHFPAFPVSRVHTCPGMLTWRVRGVGGNGQRCKFAQRNAPIGLEPNWTLPAVLTTAPPKSVDDTQVWTRNNIQRNFADVTSFQPCGFCRIVSFFLEYRPVAFCPWLHLFVCLLNPNQAGIFSPRTGPDFNTTLAPATKHD